MAHILSSLYVYIWNQYYYVDLKKNYVGQARTIRN